MPKRFQDVFSVSCRQFGNPGIERTQEFADPLGRVLPSSDTTEELT